MKFILLAVSAITSTLYIIYILRNFAQLNSISESFYRLRWSRKPIFIGFIVMLCFPIAIVVGTELMTLACGLLLTGVGADPIFKQTKMSGLFHYFGAIAAILIAFISQMVDFHIFYLAPIMGLFIIIAGIYIKFPIFWIEVAAFVLIFTGILINLI